MGARTDSRPDARPSRERADLLDALIATIRRENGACVRRYKLARQLTKQVTARFYVEMDSIKERVNPRLKTYGIRFLLPNGHKRWHYPDRISAQDLDSRSFRIALYSDRERAYIGHVFFAVLGPDLFETEDHGVTILASNDDGSDCVPREYRDRRSMRSVCRVIELELVACVEPELRAQIPPVD